MEKDLSATFDTACQHLGQRLKADATQRLVHDII
jgi:hypothetical protein